MKFLHYLVWMGLSIVLLFGLQGCNSKSGKSELKSIYTALDTTIVTDMITSYLDLIHDKNYDKAFDMLYFRKRDSINAITDSTRLLLKQQYMTFPVLKYKIMNSEWDIYGNVNYSTSVEFFEKPEGSDIPNTIKIDFAPFRKDGIWYLSLHK